MTDFNEYFKQFIEVSSDPRYVIAIAFLVIAFKMDLSHSAHDIVEIVNITCENINKICRNIKQTFLAIIHKHKRNVWKMFEEVGSDGYGHNALAQFTKGCISWLSSNSDMKVSTCKEFNAKVNEFTTTCDADGNELINRAMRIFSRESKIFTPLSKIKPILEMSLHDNIHLDELRESLLPIVKNLDEIISKEAISMYNADVITHSQYTELCRRFTDGNL